MKLNTLAKIILSGALVVASSQTLAAKRDTISIVGSSTVYPFTTVVAERFGKMTNFRTPKVESTGTGGGMKLFCAGDGINTPDVANASRRMKKTEYQMCQKNGVTAITEVLIGYDGIVIANTKEAKQMNLTRKDVFLALAKDVPALDGSDTLVPNFYQTWKEVNPALPNTKIEVLGPPPTSGTRDAFVELVLEGGCKKFKFIKAMKKTNKKQFKEVCHSVREDHKYIEAGENDNLIVQKLMANPKALGIFGFSFLDQNSDKIQGSKIDNVVPEFDSIADGSYAISRPLYFYVKNSHAATVPGMVQFLKEFTSESSMGEEGYLTDKGLIPLPVSKLELVRSDVLSLKKLHF
ncbi:MAG: phosphate transport system substrate-binding protein [Phenylobacterium sp.]|jgi:phosphate transport system substrate-binding protein